MRENQPQYREVVSPQVVVSRSVGYPVWRQTVLSGARHLLRGYFESHSPGKPIKLGVLATTNRTGIQWIDGIEAPARLIPRAGGFLILLRRDVTGVVARTKIAHELAHTLFYRDDTNPPTRELARSAREEVFCSDVARQVLLPGEAVRATGIDQMSSPVASLKAAIAKMRVSRDVAAKSLLQDHLILAGIAGWWKCADGVWTPIAGLQYASRGESAATRARLRRHVARALRAESYVAFGGYEMWAGDDGDRVRRFAALVRFNETRESDG